MDLQPLISPERVTFLSAGDRESALEELLSLFDSNVTAAGGSLQDIGDQLRQRELLVTTRVAPGITIPHARVRGIEKPLIGFGISRNGVPWDDQHEEPVHLVVMILWRETTDVHILSEVARRLSRADVYRRMIQASDAREALAVFASSAEVDAAKVPERDIELARELTRHASQIAVAMNADALIVHLDVVGSTRFLDSVERSVRTILVTADPTRYPGLERLEKDVVTLPFRGMTKANMGDLSILFVLSQGALRRGDRVVSVVGDPDSGILDTVAYADVGQRFDVFFAIQDSDDGKPADIADVVYNRAIQLAHELAVEGREGKAIGALFVLGDHQEVLARSHQLVVNPFLGYPEEQRNILDPSLEETVKEFSRIDGAFLIRGDGVIEAAGLYLRGRARVDGVPAGLGARHSAAAAITAETGAVSIAVSESTRRISIFRSGRRLMVF